MAEQSDGLLACTELWVVRIAYWEVSSGDSQAPTFKPANKKIDLNLRHRQNDANGEAARGESRYLKWGGGIHGEHGA